MRMQIPALLVAALVGSASVIAADDSSTAVGGRVFEMRTYFAAEGKLQDLHGRFRKHTNAMFKKHGMDVVGYWTPQAEPGKPAPETIVYILAFPDREAAKASWTAFAADPAWQKAKADSEKDGKLVAKIESVFLDPTDYSPTK